MSRSADCEKAKEMQSKLKAAKDDVEYRLQVISQPVVKPSAPPLPEAHKQDERNGIDKNRMKNCEWEDARTLVSIDEGVRLFHVDSRKSVSTWSTPCNLKIFQLLGENKDPTEPPAFLQCGDWVYPLHPGISPALKTFSRTYMFPDISLQPQDGEPASVGIVFAGCVAEIVIERFERILSCYCDFRKLTASDIARAKPPRPPPTYQNHKEKTICDNDNTTGRELVPVQPREITEIAISDEEERSWSDKVSSGILIGAKWVSWGLAKGAQVTSHLVEQGATKLRERLQPNEEPSKVDPETVKNVQQIKEVTGAAVKVSGFIVSTLCTLTVELGRHLSPVIRTQGAKLIPAKYKNGDDGKKTMDELVQVAAAGVKGFSAVFTSLEESGKVLYRSITKATVETVHHKYGEDASDVTGDAMAAAGNTAQAYWNVKKLGTKAIAKRAAKDTSKAVLMDADESTRSGQMKAITNG
ncbi:spartin-like isoform X2 [Rhopilema esculentum]